VTAVAVLLLVAWKAARPFRWRPALALVVLGVAGVLSAWTFRSALRLTFVNGDFANELLVYAHGTPDLKRALAEIREIAARTGEGDALEVAYDDDTTWPLSWYLRDFHRQRYLGHAPAPPALLAPVVMIGSKNVGAAGPHLERDYVRREYRLIWWPAEDYTRSGPRDLLRALAHPARRRRLLRYLIQRETGYERTDWPLRHDFTMFVRKDLVARAWPLGLEALRAKAPAAPAVPRFDCAAEKVLEGPFDGQALQAPAAVAVGSDGRRLIADTGAHRIVVLDRKDAFVRAFGGRCDLSKGAAGGCWDPDGTGPLQAGDGQLLEPWGVAAGPDGGTLVADTWNGRVVSFDPNGRFVRGWGRLSVGATPPVPADLLYGPRGIAYDAGRRVVAVADTGHKRILLYGPEGTLQREHGGPGKEAGRFDEPVGLAFGPDGSLYVADAWNRRIQRFDATMQGTGEWPVDAWGSRALADKPYVAVARSGAVYASDPAGGRVLVYTPDGILAATLAGPGWSREPRTRPTGLAVDDAGGLLLVADPARNRVWSLAVSGRADQPCRTR
jgi:DNA-binding beta-propeller fold protein YncE